VDSLHTRDIPPASQARNLSLLAGRVPQLDGLRGVAILLVISLHYLNDSEHGAFGTFLYRFGSAFRLGWSGVDLFFVLSGFLIGGILLDARRAENYFSAFYVRRFFRILPLFYAWLSLFAVVSLFFGTFLSEYLPVLSSDFRLLPVYFLFLQNYFTLSHSSLAWYWLAPAWSLGVEEQFYLISPPLVRFLSIARLKTVLLATICLAPLLRTALLLLLSPASRSGVSLWMPCRADSLAIGVLAALLWRQGVIQNWYAAHRTMFYVILALLASALPVFTKWLFAPDAFWMASLGLSWLAFLYVGLLLWCLLEPRGLWSRFLQWSFLREMGRLSYCIYLIHLLLLGLCHALLRHQRPSIATFPAASISLLALLLTLLLAKLSWHFFEHPLIHRGHTRKYRLTGLGE
jgi:peptidoglycan/LPS O-acetylase OafA/YrhL